MGKNNVWKFKIVFDFGNCELLANKKFINFSEIKELQKKLDFKIVKK